MPSKAKGSVQSIKGGYRVRIKINLPPTAPIRPPIEQNSHEGSGGGANQPWRWMLKKSKYSSVLIGKAAAARIQKVPSWCAPKSNIQPGPAAHPVAEKRGLPPPPPELKKEACRLGGRRVGGGKRMLEGPTATAIQLTRSLIVPRGRLHPARSTTD